jgi:tetratricopeptide (TPR) repeat protein
LTRHGPLRSWAAGVLLASALGAIVWTQRRIDALLGGFRAQEDILYLWSGRNVKRLAPGFEGLAADIYWLRTVQYFGGKRVFSADRKFELLEPLMDITVTLDPRLEIAYRYGSIFLAEPAPIGAGRVDSALALLERGARANPGNWRLPKEQAYLYYLFKHDAQTASRILRQASAIPGAPYWLDALSADFLGRQGDRATARRIWQQMYDESEEGAIKQNALTHLRLLDTAEMRERLQAKVREFEQAMGRRPASLAELAQRGFVRSVPDDPSGVPFEYDAKTGAVTASRQSVLWRGDQ